MRWLILLNDAAGTLAKAETGGAVDRIRAACVAHGVDADVRGVEATELTDVARRATREGFDAVVAGGGDGTLNAVASGVIGSGVPFAVLPLGTHNHFAKDIGVPLEIEPAVEALATGVAIDLPVGEVNGRPFLNFSGIGLHPRVVKHRDAQRHALGRSKWFAMVVAMGRALVDFPVIRVRLTADGRTIVRNTPSVIVCNNEHQIKVFGVENASYTDRRVLNVYVARATSRTGLVWLMAKAAMGRLETAATFEAMAVGAVRIDTRRRRARVSIDGEIVDLHPPLDYTVRQTGLRVIVPAAKADNAV